jgi:hypothetical protein
LRFGPPPPPPPLDIGVGGGLLLLQIPIHDMASVAHRRAVCAQDGGEGANAPLAVAPASPTAAMAAEKVAGLGGSAGKAVWLVAPHQRSQPLGRQVQRLGEHADFVLQHWSLF